MRKIINLILLIALFSCSSPLQDRASRWAALFVEKEKQDVLLNRANQKFLIAKQMNDAIAMKNAEADYQFLVTEYTNSDAQKRITEIEKFYLDYTTYFKTMVSDAVKKDLTFTAAGYYKKILLVNPTDKEGTDYLNTNSEKINKLLASNLENGNKYLKNKDYFNAKQTFIKILNVNPNSEAALLGLEEVEKIKKVTKNKSVKKLESEDIKRQSNSDMETAYQNAIKAFEAKDFLKALDLFDDIDDKNYKDTSLYMNRTQDKINALGLSKD